MQDKANHYQVLEVDPRASEEVIHAAYRALAKSHPENLLSLNLAKDTLYDISLRREYDRQRNKQEGKIVGNYRILKQIATGGFGTTYQAKHLLTDELVCIKHCSNISPEHDAVLINEAKAMWDLRHFSVPAVRDVQRLDDGSLVLVCSFIEGLTIEQIVNKIGPIPEEHVAWMVERILNALWYMHEKGVVHGDIKPQNIIIQQENHMACLVDFGLSMVQPKSTDQCVGWTEYFAPPEQEQRKPLLPQSDFYSLGILILYALCGGQMRIVAARSVPSTVPEPFANFIKRLIVRDVMKRPSWETENLYETFQNVRRESFGRSHTDMSLIPGL